MNINENYYTMRQVVLMMVQSSKGTNSYQYCRKILNQKCIAGGIVGACKVGSYWLLPKIEVEKYIAARYTTIS